MDANYFLAFAVLVGAGIIYYGLFLVSRAIEACATNIDNIDEQMRRR